MVLQIGILQNENNKWLIAYPDGATVELALELDCTTVFIARDQYWEEVYCGEAVLYHGEIDGIDYEGPAIELKCGNKATGKVVPIPSAAAGMWYAFKWYENDAYWELEPGIQICTPPGTGDYVAGTYQRSPRGKCVCTVIRTEMMKGNTMGRIALDLAYLPFPKEMWFYDGEVFQESGLDFLWNPDDIDRTRELFGELDPQSLFWL